MSEPFQVLIKSKGVDELEALLNDPSIYTREDGAPGDPPPPAEPVPEATPVEPEPTPEPEPEPEATPTENPVVEPDPVASALEGERIRRERLEADLELQKAHGSRLAGELGHLKQLLQSRPSEPYQPETPEELDRVTSLERQVSELKSRSASDAVQSAVAQEIAAIDAMPESKDLSAEFAAVAPKYVEQFQDALKIEDPSLARQIARAIGRSVLADAKEMAWTNGQKELQARREASTANLQKIKKASAISGSGGSVAPIAKPKTTTDLSPAELDAKLREMFKE